LLPIVKSHKGQGDSGGQVAGKFINSEEKKKKPNILYSLKVRLQKIFFTQYLRQIIVK
jgi:hypothetical protein